MVEGVGRRGPIPLSDNVRRLRGTKGRRSSARPTPVRAAPSPPKWLSAEARAEWRRVVPELERLGLLARLDRAVLTEFCSTWAHWVSVSRLLDTSTATAPDPTHPDRASRGVRKHPMWSSYCTLSSLLSSLAKELGLSPNARARMVVPETDSPDPDGILD
jgi:P27 family predicted phage terminase small subunit